MYDRFGQLTHPMQADGEIVMSERTGRLELHNMSIVVNRFLRSFLLQK